MLVDFWIGQFLSQLCRQGIWSTLIGRLAFGFLNRITMTEMNTNPLNIQPAKLRKAINDRTLPAKTKIEPSSAWKENKRVNWW